MSKVEEGSVQMYFYNGKQSQEEYFTEEKHPIELETSSENIEAARESEGSHRFVSVEADGEVPIMIGDKEVIIWDELCRICASSKSSKKLIPIFSDEGAEYDLTTKIHKYLPIKISEADTYPQKVCYDCAATLVAWHEMSTGCLQAQKRLFDLHSKLNLKEEDTNDSLEEDGNMEFTLNSDVDHSDESQPEDAKSECTNNKESAEDNLEIKRCSNGKQKSDHFNEFIKKHKPSLPKKSNLKKSFDCTTRRSTRSRIVKLTAEVDNLSEAEMIECNDLKVISSEGKKISAKKKVITRTSMLKCSDCGKRFRLKESYEMHRKVHQGELPYTCKECGKQFGSNGSFYYHMKHVHGGVKNHACDICGRCFAMKTAMMDHRRIHTGERPYVCDSCGKTFKTKASLFVHSKLHSEEFPFKCKYCKKQFRWKGQMVCHEITHTGEKNHMCDICGKGFGVKNELTRHSRTHSMEKPFTCQKCGVSFGQQRYLTNHNRMRHRKLEKKDQ